MSNKINRYSSIFSITIMLLSLSSSIFSQSYQGCVNSERQSRFAFKFIPISPNSNVNNVDSARVLVKPNDKIVFVVAKVDETYTEESVRNVQRAAPYIFEDSLRNIAVPTENLYALIQDGTNFREELSNEKYVFPIEPASDGREIPGGKMILLKRNSNGELEFDTAGMRKGYYWITLQGNVTFAGQKFETCAKTTPPVLVQIAEMPTPTPTPRNNPPTVELSVEGKACELRTLTATVKDEDNKQGKEQNLSLTWEITERKTKRNYEVQKMQIGNPTDASYSEKANSVNLPPGIYDVKVTAWDGVWKGVRATASDVLEINCKGAGIVYFQFDEPYETRMNLFNPEDWVKNYGRRNQCVSGTYPKTDFNLFYTQTGTNPLSSFSTNTARLEEIIRVLNANPNLRLHIAGYADFRAKFDYNHRLVQRRINAVKQYLSIRVTNTLTGKENFADTKAQICYGNACDDPRRYDRRVELIYYTGNEPPLPKYSDSSCPENANLIINPIYENDWVIFADE